MKTLSSRRDFLKAAALSGTAAIITGCSNPASLKDEKLAISLNKNPLKLGLMTYTLGRDWDIETIIKNCTEAKFLSVELRTTHAHGVEVSLSTAERAEVKKRFDDSALESISLASAWQYHSPDANELKRNIEGTKEFVLLARDVGAKGIRVFPNAIPEGVPEEKTFEQIGKAVAEVGAFANEYGVEIRLSDHGRGTNKIPVIKKIIDYSQSPHVYVNWNCDKNATIGEANEDTEVVFKRNFNLVKERIRNLHIHELFNEDYPYRLLFKLLADSGYTGYCHAEINSSPDAVRLMKYYRSVFLSLQNAY